MNLQACKHDHPVVSRQQPRKVLVVDDDLAILDAVGLILEEEGYTVCTVAGGNIVQAAAREQPDVVLLDLRLSGQDGRDVCRALKASRTTAHIPVIVVSANHQGAAYAQQAGADDFLAKPFELDDFLTKVATWVVRNDAG